MQLSSLEPSLVNHLNDRLFDLIPKNADGEHSTWKTPYNIAGYSRANLSLGSWYKVKSQGIRSHTN